MTPLTIALLAQLAAPVRLVLPVLSIPEPGLDDSAVYQEYQTRFFRDAANNTVQIYVDQHDARVVHLWADAENESIGFTARDARGQPAQLRWNGPSAAVSSDARTRTLEHQLVATTSTVHLGAFLLGSMRVERDFQYEGRHRASFGGRRFSLPETDRLVTMLGRLGPAERQRHLALLGAADLPALRARLQPRVVSRRSDSSWVARLVQPSLDGRDTLSLELEVDPRAVTGVVTSDSVTLRARAGGQLSFTARIATTGAPLTPLARTEIFTPEFLAFLAAARTGRDSSAGATDTASLRARRLERQVRGVELLSSREKLMAGLPTYATYFGRDMMVSALMMRSIWTGAMSEAVIASVLRKLSPRGEVSHEEALGGQAVREAAAEYATLIDAQLAAARRGDRRAADTVLARARDVLGNARRPRENYHMIDDEFQLPVLTARWLDDPGVPADHKRAFLLDSSDGGGSRLDRLLRELALVSRLTAAYVGDPVAANLIPFAPREPTGWASASWRDSGAGYAGGRYPMDVNAIWVPHALEAIDRILTVLRTLGLSADAPRGAARDSAATTALATYARDSLALRAAAKTWQGAARHFIVRLGPAEVRAHVVARLAVMPRVERSYWTARLASPSVAQDSLTFLAISLDSRARPIGVANTDPATRLFLDAVERRPEVAGDADAQSVLRDVRLFVRPYPVGLLVDRVGPVVANDAYATPPVWREFVRDPYHGPRVVWGRELNLFLLGVAGRIASAAAAPSDPSVATYVRELRAAATQVRSAAAASGFHSELWSYGFASGRPGAIRYGSGADVQLWSTTDLAVQFALSRLGL